MKKILTVMLSITFFGACTKQKAIPPQPKDMQSESNSNIGSATLKQLTDTLGNNENRLKKKVAKVKYPKQKLQKQ